MLCLQMTGVCPWYSLGDNSNSDDDDDDDEGCACCVYS